MIDYVRTGTSNEFQRAPGAPLLPAEPFRFVLYFVARRRWWFLAIILLEAANSTCGITIPLALSHIIKAVTHAQAQSQALVHALTAPLLLFLGLGLGEVLFGELPGTSSITSAHGNARKSRAKSMAICRTTRIVSSATISPGRWRIASARCRRAST